ncbi:MAG: sulfite exporter TauE/SafE family protein [Clostridia bacterium]|nr:sulfite exporter TauE/SafE family protein [Clostridia bacterium]
MSFLAIVLNIVLGAIAGVFGGLGMGGGTLLIPMLTIFLSFPQKLAQGINLVSFLVMALFSLVIHFKNGYVHTKGTMLLICFGVLASAGGALLAGVVPNKILRVCFGAFLCILSVFQLVSAIKK